jgi:hypothetical protein
MIRGCLCDTKVRRNDLITLSLPTGGPAAIDSACVAAGIPKQSMLNIKAYRIGFSATLLTLKPHSLRLWKTTTKKWWSTEAAGPGCLLAFLDASIRRRSI